MSVYQPICLPVPIYIYTSIYTYIYIYVYLFIYIYIYTERDREELGQLYFEIHITSLIANVLGFRAPKNRRAQMFMHFFCSF